MTIQELAKRIERTHTAQLYRERYFSNATDHAQDQLMGRTHYVDPQTLRFHKSRVLSARTIAEGLLFRVTESCALDPDNTRRGFRAVVFDIYGDAVYRPSLDQCRASRDPADRDCARWLESFDVVAHYRNAIESRAERMNKDAAALLAAIVDEVTA